MRCQCWPVTDSCWCCAHHWPLVSLTLAVSWSVSAHPQCLVTMFDQCPAHALHWPLTSNNKIFFQNLRFLFALTRRSWVAPLWSPRPVHWNVNYLPEPGRPETRSSIIYWSLVNCPPRLGINNSINLSWNLHHLAAWLPVTLCQTNIKLTAALNTERAKLKKKKMLNCQIVSLLFWLWRLFPFFWGCPVNKVKSFEHWNWKIFSTLGLIRDKLINKKFKMKKIALFDNIIFESELIKPYCKILQNNSQS